MADFYNDMNRSARQRRYFPVKLREDLRQQICLRYAMGESIASIHAWIVGSKGIQISYAGVHGYTRRKRWKRFMDTITRCELDDPHYSLMFARLFEDKMHYWQKIEDGYWELLKTATLHNPTQAKDFIEAARILRGFRGEKALLRLIRSSTGTQANG